MAAGVRLDRLLVERGLAPTRERAQRLIMAGVVLVDDRPLTKSGTTVAASAVIRLREMPAPYVSRGGEKLAGALDAFGVAVQGRIGLDVGASTGGFTDCLLRRGAASVVAVDVGYGQLAWSLRQDARVTVVERVNARHLTVADVGVIPELVTMDVSFISATLVLPSIASLLAPVGDVIVLVKPQFEVGRDQVGKGGIVRDDALRASAVDRVRAAAMTLGLAPRAQADSVLPGPGGNREIFLWLSRG